MSVEDSPIPPPNGITVGGRADEVFVPVEGYEYLEPPAAVLERFTAGFEAQGAAAQVVDSVAARTVVRDGAGDESAVVISIAIDDSVGPLAEGFRDGVLSSMTAQATPEDVDLAGVPATFVDTGEQQALYVQQDTTVLFFLGAAGRDPLVEVATALLASRGASPG